MLQKIKVYDNAKPPNPLVNQHELNKYVFLCINEIIEITDYGVQGFKNP